MLRRLAVTGAAPGIRQKQPQPHAGGSTPAGTDHGPFQELPVAARPPTRTVYQLRRPVIGRDPVHRVPFAPRKRWRMPGWLRSLLLSQLAFILLFTLLNELQKP